MKKINVYDEYDVIIQNGIFENINEEMSNYNKKIAIVDSKVKIKKFRRAFDDIFYLNVKEDSKNTNNLFKLIDFFKKNNLKRESDIVVAIGGGVTLDLVGLASSLYKRGLDMFFVPTTLLSQVDASVGGKNSVHYKGLKNTIGTFYNPKKVLIDPNFLKTLDKREIKSGIAEILKISFLMDKRLLILLSDYKKEDYNWEEVIYKAVSFKIHITKEDYKDNSIRKILNFGHTFGHAIEAYYKYTKYTHGEAVSIGMALASMDKRIIKVLKIFDLPTHLEEEIDYKKLFHYMLEDKKNITENVQIISLRDIEKPDFEYIDNYIQVKLRNEKVKLIENEIKKI